MNENLRRALLRARLSDEDVAARLEVDPKTVRRWLEGRTPYLRHRWALAGMLGLDETDLWPQAWTTHPYSAEVQAIYPHCESVPTEVWLNLFGSAEQEIDILDSSGLFLAADTEILAILADRAKVGVQERICLHDLDSAGAASAAGRSRDARAQYERLSESDGVEMRLHCVSLNNLICRADDQLLVGQRIFGINARQSPVLHLHRMTTGDLADIYLDSFNVTWTRALPA